MKKHGGVYAGSLGAMVALLAAGAMLCASPPSVTVDGIGDAVARRTDPGGDNPFDPIQHRLIDLSDVTIGAWDPTDAQADLFAGTFGGPADHFLRLDLTLDGLVNPPGRADPIVFDPFAYGDHPVYGFVEIDMDADVDTGGELDAPEFRFLGNVVRFGGRPSTGLVDRVASDGSAFDGVFLTAPFVERHGEEFHLALFGTEFTALDITEQVGDGDLVFEAGETWNIDGRFFHRAHGFEPFSLAFGGMTPGEYAPDTTVRFRHDVGSDVTVVSLVFPRNQTGAAEMRGEAVQPRDGDPSNHASVEEGLHDLHESAEFLYLFPTGLPEEAIINDWRLKSASDFISPTNWTFTILLGTSYTAMDPLGEFYVWTDICPNVARGDVNGDASADATDVQQIQQFIIDQDASDGQVDGRVVILAFAADFDVHDINHDGVVDGCDAALAAEDGSCDDGDICTSDDTCTNGVCAGALQDCSSMEDACNMGVCNGVTGVCEAQPANQGGDCDDGTFCNGVDTCDQGTCVSPGDPCVPGMWCDETTDACFPHGNGDFDGNGAVDLADFAAFQPCFGQPAGGGCEPGNLTGDAMIDLADFAAFASVMTGPL